MARLTVGKVEKENMIERKKEKTSALTSLRECFFSSLFSSSSNYVVKREAIKTQEIEQQSHLRGCRFATVY